LFSLSMDMLCVIGLDGSFKRVNPAFTRMLGYPEAALLSKSIPELAHPDHRETVGIQMRQLREGNPVNYLESRFLCADGATKWLAWSIAPFVSEGTAYAVARDRTPQKQDEQTLRQSHDRLICLLESTTDAFFAVDRGWRVITVNQQAERLWSRKREGLLDRNLWDLFPEAVGGPFYCMYHRAMDTGAPGHIEEFYAPMQRWFEVHAYPSPEGLSVYFRDFTDRRATEERIQRALQEKEVLLREVHHRVKNNLQVICSMLRLQAGYVSDQGLLQVLRECRERVLAMAMLHDQLHRAKDLSQINLGEYVRNLASSVFCSYGVNSAQIELRMDVEDVTVPIDTAIPCGLIVQELLSNSLRHAFLEGQKGRVWVLLCALPGDRIELTVCDDGRGFPEAGGAPSHSLGLRLVDLFAQQIEATVERNGKSGALCRLVFQGQKSKGEEVQ
jgi:PAS domain S-box-containing protein